MDEGKVQCHESFCWEEVLHTVDYIERFRHFVAYMVDMGIKRQVFIEKHTKKFKAKKTGIRSLVR